MMRRPPRSTPLYSSAASDVYKRQGTRGPRACRSKNSPSSNLAAEQWEFPIVKSPHWLQSGTPYLPPKLPLPADQSPKPHYLPHPWTRPTYHAKRHPDPFRRFSTVHWRDPSTHRQTNRWSVGMVRDYRPLLLYRQLRSLTTLSIQQFSFAYAMKLKSTT